MGRGDRGTGPGSRVTKAAPPCCRWQPPSWCFRGHPWSWGSVSRSICKYPHTGKGGNLAAPAVSRRFLHQMNFASSPLARLSQTPETKPWSPLSGSLSTASCERVTAQEVLQSHILGERMANVITTPVLVSWHRGLCKRLLECRTRGKSRFLSQQKKKNEFHCEMKANKEFQD